MRGSARRDGVFLAICTLVVLGAAALPFGAALAQTDPTTPAAPAPFGIGKPRSEKVSSPLDQILAGGASAQAQGPGERSTQAADGVLVTVEANAGHEAAAASAVTNAGGRVRTTYRQLIDAVIPITKAPSTIARLAIGPTL